MMMKKFRILMVLVALIMVASGNVADAQDDKKRLKLEFEKGYKPIDIISQLRDADIIPGGGKIGVQLRTGFAETRKEGSSYLSIGRGAEFRDFVLNFEVRLADIEGEQSSCGMAFRGDGEKFGLVFLTANREIGLVQFDDGETIIDFYESVDDLDGVDSSDFSVDSDNVNTITLTAVDDVLTLFVNGLEITTQEKASEVRGVFAFHIFNEEGNTNLNQCRYGNVWAWSLD
jgi:hypothetical protein